MSEGDLGKELFVAKEITHASEYKKWQVDYRIDEEKIFSREEILGYIEHIARAEGIDASKVEVHKEAVDANGNLVYMLLELKPEEAKKYGWGEVTYYYMIKGDQVGMESSVGSTGVSRIMRTHTAIDDYIPTAPGDVARYENGVWGLYPNDAALTVSKVTP